MDTPAAIAPQNLIYFCRDAHRVLVPVLPSAIDTHTCSRLIQDLLLRGGMRQDLKRLGIVTNRSKHKTLSYGSLQRFLSSLNLQTIATIRDSQNYVRSAELGLGVAEMTTAQAIKDHGTWQLLGEWLDAALAEVQATQESGRHVALPSAQRVPVISRIGNPAVFVKPIADMPAILRAVE
jgi:chromosome partitioning protein